MKMEHEVRAEADGEVACGARRAPATWWSRASAAQPARPAARRRRPTPPTGSPRRDGRRRRRHACAPTCSSCAAREAFTLDASRPEAVAKRHALGLRTARENIADLCDAGSFVEYGALAIAAQRSRRSARRPDRATRRPTAWSPASAASTREQFGAERSRCRRHGLRLHRARRHAGHAQPPEDRPHARHRAASRSCRWCCSPKAAAAGRATSTCPSSPACTSPPSPASRALSRPGAGGRHRRRPLLRRQRRAARLLRRRSSPPRASNIGMGGPAMVEGGGLGALPARADRPERRAVAQRRDRRPGRRRGRRRSPRRGTTSSFFQGRVARLAVRRPARAARRCCPRTACASTTCAPSMRGARRPRLGCSSCAPASAPASSPRWRASRAGRSACSPTTRRTSAARSTPTRPTRPRASCSCATRTACRWSR